MRTDTTLESIRETLKELNQMCQRPPGESELKRSQSELTGALVRQMQTPASIGRLELNRRLYQFPHDFYSDFIPRVRSVTGEQVLEMARRLFDPERVVIKQSPGHPDDAVLKVTNQILGGGASARLFLNLREEKGYTYGAYSRVRSYRHDGLLLAGASV